MSIFVFCLRVFLQTNLKFYIFFCHRSLLRLICASSHHIYYMYIRREVLSWYRDAPLHLHIMPIYIRMNITARYRYNLVIFISTPDLSDIELSSVYTRFVYVTVCQSLANVGSS